MHAYEAVRERAVEKDLHAALHVVEHAQRRDRAGNQPQHGWKAPPREAKLSGRAALRPAEFLQIDALVAAHGDEKVMLPLLVVPDEEVLGVPFRVRQMNGRELLHVEYRRMLDLFIGNLLLTQKLIIWQACP